MFSEFKGKTAGVTEIFPFALSFPLFSGKHTVYFLEKIRYNCEKWCTMPQRLPLREVGTAAAVTEGCHPSAPSGHLPVRGRLIPLKRCNL